MPSALESSAAELYFPLSISRRHRWALASALMRLLSQRLVRSCQSAVPGGTTICFRPPRCSNATGMEMTSTPCSTFLLGLAGLSCGLVLIGGQAFYLGHQGGEAGGHEMHVDPSREDDHPID